MSIFNSKGYNVNLGCYVSFTFPRIVMLECEQPSLMRFVVVNATREEDDGEWTCRRSDLDETYSAFVAISKRTCAIIYSYIFLNYLFSDVHVVMKVLK